MSKTAKIIVGLIVIVLIIWGISAATKKGGTPTSNEPIKIGFIGPLTGDASSIGENAQAAVQIAVDEINSADGINGRKLGVVYEDGKCTGANSSSAANKLINIDKVSIILGGACSGETMAFTQIAELAKVPVLSYCSSNPAITTAGDFIFRNYPSDTYQGSFAAKYLFDKLGKKKVAVMYTKTDWGSGIQAVFDSEFKKLGGQIVLNEGFDSNSSDLRTLLAKVKAAKPDAVYFLGYSKESNVALNQAKDVGLATTWFGGDAWDDPTIWVALGNVGEGAMYAKVSSAPTDAFKSAMFKKTGTNDIVGCTPTAYDGLKLIVQVLRKVGDNSVDIKNELYKTEYVGGVSSNDIKFDQNGDLVGANYTVMKVKNGTASPVVE